MGKASARQEGMKLRQAAAVSKPQRFVRLHEASRAHRFTHWLSSTRWLMARILPEIEQEIFQLDPKEKAALARNIIDNLDAV